MLSAHGNPREVAEYGSTAAIARAACDHRGGRRRGRAAGVLASYTELPVIGIPIRRQEMGLGGFDALLSRRADARRRAGRLHGRERRADATRPSTRPRSWPRAQGIRLRGLTSSTSRAVHRRAAAGRLVDSFRRDLPLHPPCDGRRLVGRAPVPAVARRRDRGDGGVGRPGRRACRRRRRGAQRGPSVDVERILEIEARTHHDVLAFTESIAEQVGPEARWFHYGLTSSDVVDTALALQLRDAGELLLAGLDRAERGRAGAGRGAPPHADHRPHARRARRADHLRPEAAGLGDGAAPRPRPAGRRLRGRARRQAVRRRRHLRQLRSPRRGVRPVGARAGSRGRRHAGDPARPPRRAALRRSP